MGAVLFAATSTRAVAARWCATVAPLQLSLWEPVVPEGCNASTGIWRDGGENNQSPFYITEAVSRLTGLQVDSLVAITTHNNSFFAIGIATNWTSPMVQQEQPPRFENPQTVAWEDPYIFFDLRRKIWRVLYHEVPGKASPGFQPVLGILKHCDNTVLGQDNFLRCDAFIDTSLDKDL